MLDDDQHTALRFVWNERAPGNRITRVLVKFISHVDYSVVVRLVRVERYQIWVGGVFERC